MTEYVGAKGDVGHSPPVWCAQHLCFCTDAETPLHKFYADRPPGDWTIMTSMTNADREELDRLTAAILVILQKHNMVKTRWNQIKGTLPDGREVTQTVLVEGYVRDTEATKAAYARMSAAAEAELAKP
jgi:hypothetical protein